MSFIQGTVVRLKGRFTDRDTGEQVTVNECVLTIEDPDGVLHQYTKSAAQVTENTDDAADPFYWFDLDTMPLPGTWKYQFESTGNEATVGRKEITVKARLTAAP
jgi:hypothetical protein